LVVWVGFGALVLVVSKFSIKATPPNPLIGLEAKRTNMAQSPSAVGFRVYSNGSFSRSHSNHCKPFFFFFFFTLLPFFFGGIPFSVYVRLRFLDLEIPSPPPTPGVMVRIPYVSIPGQIEE
jgi:hypothetical protein